MLNPETSPSTLQPQSRLSLVVSTWAKQSHGLYDYQSPPDKNSKEDLEIVEPSRVFRHSISNPINKEARKTFVKQLTSQCKQLPERIEIFQVIHSPAIKHYQIKNSLSTQLDQVMLAKGEEVEKIVDKHKLFISLDPYSDRHQLGTFIINAVIGDFIKLGRVQLVVLEINNAKKTESLDFEQMYGAREYIFHLKEELEGCCKVCLSDEVTQTDPLVNPCNCKGSCGVIHLGCLKNWINNKVKKQLLPRVRTYNFEKFSCEICKAPFPTRIRVENGQENNLLDFQRPTDPYILLQQCSQTQQKTAKTLHFVFPDQGGSVNIGRGQTCELNISDISVSRTHSQIAFQKNNFYIKDLNSKFGTLIELKRELEVKKRVKLQHNGCSMIIEPKDDKKSRSGRKSAGKKSSN